MRAHQDLNATKGYNLISLYYSTLKINLFDFPTVSKSVEIANEETFKDIQGNFF